LQILTQLQKYYEKYGSNYPRSYFVKYIGFSKSSISTWLASPKLQLVAFLPECAAKKRLRNVVTKERSRFRSQQDQLYERFVYRRRARGQEVNYEWMKTQMQQIMLHDKPLGYTKFRYSNGWLQSFLDSYNISCQVQTEKKPIANGLRIPVLQAFHREVCLIQQTQGLNERCPIYGRFSPKHVYNVDQFPFVFVSDTRKSLNPVGEACWILNQGTSSLSKRMCTVVLTLRGSGEQIVPPFVLFRGEGHLDPAVLAELDEQGIGYSFNAKAWADGESCIEHLKFLSKHVKENSPETKEILLFLDGLSAQATDAFIEFALDLNILPCYFPPNCTHLLQPVDHHIGAWFKQQYSRLYQIEETANYDKWQNYRNNGSMCPQYLRKTMLLWTKICWEELKTMTDFLKSAFTSTGCLITLKGDHSIKFQDIFNYEFDYPHCENTS
jgi:hypothetical protein